MRRLQVHENQDSSSTELGSPSRCPGATFNTKRPAHQACMKVAQGVTVAVPGSPPHGSSAWALGNPPGGPHTPGRGPASGWGRRGGLAFQHALERGLRCSGQPPPRRGRARPGPRPCWGKPQCRRWLKFCILFASASRGSAAFFFFFFSQAGGAKKKKLRAAICRPWDVFLLDSLGPRLAGPSSTPRPQLWVCAAAEASCTRNRPTGREGWREAGWEAAARPGTALLCARFSQPPLSPCRPARPALHPPGCPHLLGPASWLGCCSRPGRPATSSAQPLLTPPCRQRSGEPGTVPGCLGAQPGRGGGRGGVRRCQQRERPRCPASPRGLPLPPVSRVP